MASELCDVGLAEQAAGAANAHLGRAKVAVDAVGEGGVLVQRHGHQVALGVGHGLAHRLDHLRATRGPTDTKKTVGAEGWKTCALGGCRRMVGRQPSSNWPACAAALTSPAAAQPTPTVPFSSPTTT